MGDPKRIRKKYQKTKMMWNKERIEHEHDLRDRYGLANMHELWKATTEVGKIRRNVREVLAGRATEQVGSSIIERLVRYGIVKSGATLDDLLVVSPEAILDRRLQSIVYKKGMSKSIRQARQLIAHGFIAINGHRVNAPGYLVTREEEEKVSYYKPINLEHNLKSDGEKAAGTAQGKQAQVAEENKGE
ncbi:MAG: 30S ribosomal protein S4 [Candidatus Micrarchaeaceae archaeon]